MRDHSRSFSRRHQRSAVSKRLRSRLIERIYYDVSCRRIITAFESPRMVVQIPKPERLPGGIFSMLWKWRWMDR